VGGLSTLGGVARPGDEPSAFQHASLLSGPGVTWSYRSPAMYSSPWSSWSHSSARRSDGAAPVGQVGTEMWTKN